MGERACRWSRVRRSQGTTDENQVVRWTPRSVRRDHRILDSDEITRLLDAALPRFRPLLATAMFTGLRQGELLGLRWQDVDLDAGVVHVRGQLDRDRRLVEPKTPESVREVVLMPALARVLREHQLASPFSRPEHFVFSTERGGPMLWRNVTRRAFAAAVERAELEANGKRRPTFHDLRRTFGSLLIYQGEDVVYVSRQMGHSSPKVTLDIYARLFNAREQAERARARMESTFRNLLETTRGEQRRTAGAADGSKVAQLRASATGGD